MTAIPSVARAAALLILSTSIPAVATAGQGGASAAAARPVDEVLAEVNAASRAEYARARATALAKAGPIVEVWEGDRVVLVHAGRRIEARFDPPESPNLKAVAHVPLAVWSALDMAGDQPIPEARVVELRAYRDRILAARSSLTAGAFLPSPLERQQQILEASIGALDSAISRRSVAATEPGAFARKMAPLVLANIREAARGQIDRLHAIVSGWRSQLSAEEWTRLHVVIMGVHMAREDELSLQYFVRLLNEPGEGRRVVYAEGLFDEARALELLGTHLIDGRAGTAFFGHDLRMHRDVLADAARERLDELGVGH